MKVLLLFLLTSAYALDCEVHEFEGPNHCDICDTYECFNRTASLNCHPDKPRNISDTCGTACGVGKTILAEDYFTCVDANIDCGYTWGVCSVNNTQSPVITQLAYGTGEACPEVQTCVDISLNYKDLRTNMRTANFKDARFGSKSLFRKVVESFNLKKIKLMVRQKVDDRANAAADLLGDFKTKKLANNFNNDKGDRVKALKLMMPKKFRLTKKKYTVNTGLNKQQKIDAVKADVASTHYTVEELVDVKFIKNVEYNGNTYEICEDDVANVIWTGNHNIIEVYSQSDYDDTSKTTGDERHGFEQNTEEIVYDLHAQSGITRYFKCGAHPGSKFKIHCSGSRRRLLQTEETDDVDVTVHNDTCATGCEDESICTGYIDPSDNMCYPHTECDSDEYEHAAGTASSDTDCQPCSANNDMWLDTSVDAVGVCTIKPSCNKGEKYQDNGPTVEPQCIDCTSLEYQDQELHKETACKTRLCNAGEDFTDNGPDAAPTCSSCGNGTFLATQGHQTTSCTYKNNHALGSTPGCDVGKGLYYPDPESKTEDDYECLPCDDDNAGVGSTYNQGVSTINKFNADSSSTAECELHEVFYNCVNEDTCTSLACTSGHYLIEGNNQTDAVCQACVAGSVSMLHAIDLGGCAVCGGDQHPNNANEVEAYVNSVCVDDTPCARGNAYATDNDNTIDSATCTPCVAGEFLTTAEASSKTGTCSVCTGLGKQTVGENDTFVATGASKCEECPPGTYDHDNSTHTECLVCPAGHISSAGSIECTVCADGEQVINNQCVECNPGYVSNGGLACTACDVGSSTDNDKVQSRTSCYDCADGWVAAGGSGSCTECTPGTYNDGTPKATCDICINTKYQDLAGQTGCKVCAAGFIQDTNTGATSCTECAGGYISSSGDTSCTVCNAGTKEVDNVCVDCPNEKYQDEAGKTSCKVCGDGYRQNTNTAATMCTDCSDGYVSNSGDTTCGICTPGTYNDGTAKATCDNCQAGQFQHLSGQTSCNALTQCQADIGSSNENNANKESSVEDRLCDKCLVANKTPQHGSYVSDVLATVGGVDVHQVCIDHFHINVQARCTLSSTRTTDGLDRPSDAVWIDGVCVDISECTQHDVEVETDTGTTRMVLSEECNAGICQEMTGNPDYTCDCFDGYSGDNCAIPDENTLDLTFDNGFKLSSYDSLLQKRFESELNPEIQLCAGNDYYLYRMEAGNPITIELDAASNDPYVDDFNSSAGAPVIGDDGTPPPTTVIEWTKVGGIGHCWGDGAPISFDTSIDTEQACSTKSQNDCSGDCIWHVDKCLIVSKTIFSSNTNSAPDAASCYNQCILDDPFNNGNYIGPTDVTSINWRLSDKKCLCNRLTSEVCDLAYNNKYVHTNYDYEVWLAHEVAIQQPVVDDGGAAQTTPTTHTSGVGDTSLDETECQNWASENGHQWGSAGNLATDPLGCFYATTWGLVYYNNGQSGTACSNTKICIKKVSTRRRLTSFTKLRIDTNSYGYKPHLINLGVGTYTYKNDAGVGGTIVVEDCTEVEALEAVLEKNSEELVAELATKSAKTLNMLDAKGQTLAHKVASNLKNVRDLKSTLAVLKQQGADLSKKDRQGKGVIELAARELLANAVGAERETIKVVLKEAVRDVCKFKTVKKIADRPAGKTDEEWEEYECGLLDKSSVYCQVRSNSRRRRLLQDDGGMDIYDEETGTCNGYFLNEVCTAYSICAEHQYMSVMGDNETDHTCTDREYCGPGYGVAAIAVDAATPGVSGTPTNCTLCTDGIFYSDDNAYSKVNAGASCTVDADCPARITCGVDSVCGLKANGENCDAADQCVSAHCGANYKCMDLNPDGCKIAYTCQGSEVEAVAPTTSSNRECRCDWGYGRKVGDFEVDVVGWLGLDAVNVHSQTSGSCHNCGVEGLTHGYCACHNNMYSSGDTCLPCSGISTNVNTPSHPDPLTAGDTRHECVCSTGYRVTVINDINTCVHCPDLYTSEESSVYVENACVWNENLCKFNQHVKFGLCMDCPPGLKNKRGDDPTGADTQCDDPHLCSVDEQVVVSINGVYKCLPCAFSTFTHGGDDPTNGVATECCPYNTYETVAADAYTNLADELVTIDRQCETCGNNGVKARDRYTELMCCLNTGLDECKKLKIDIDLHCEKDTC